MLRQGHGGLYKVPTEEERRKQKAKMRERSGQAYWPKIWKMASCKIQEEGRRKVRGYKNGKFLKWKMDGIPGLGSKIWKRVWADQASGGSEMPLGIRHNILFSWVKVCESIYQRSQGLQATLMRTLLRFGFLMKVALEYGSWCLIPMIRIKLGKTWQQWIQEKLFQGAIIDVRANPDLLSY